MSTVCPHFQKHASAAKFWLSPCLCSEANQKPQKDCLLSKFKLTFYLTISRQTCTEDTKISASASSAKTNTKQADQKYTSFSNRHPRLMYPEFMLLCLAKNSYSYLACLSLDCAVSRVCKPVAQTHKRVQTWPSYKVRDCGRSDTTNRIRYATLRMMDIVKCSWLQIN